MNDAEFQKLLNAEPPVILKSGKYEGLTSFLFMAALVVWLGYQGKDHIILNGWWICLFLLIILAGLFWLALIFFFHSELVLNKEGFIENDNVTNLLSNKLNKQYTDEYIKKKLERRQNFTWAKASDFKAQNRRNRSYRVYFKDDIGETNLLNNYGMKPKQLAQLMNRWRERALAGK